MNIKVINSVDEARAILADVAELFRICYHRDFCERLWEQYYFLNPYGSPTVALLYDGRTLVGHHALAPQQLAAGDGRTVPYLLSLSLMLHPDSRGPLSFRQLVSASTQAAAEMQATFVLGFPNANSFLPLQRFFGWRPLLETPLYDWKPICAGEAHGKIARLPTFSLSDELSHPRDAVYLRWRSHFHTYGGVIVNDRLSVIYRHDVDRVLTVLDVQSSEPEMAASDMAALAGHLNALSTRITGFHAENIGVAPEELRSHEDYLLRMCAAPIAAQPPQFRFSLLLSDVF